VDQVLAPVQRALWDAKNPPLSRRDLFRLMARQGQVAMARAMENSLTTSKRQPGRDRLRLLAAVSHLPSERAAVVREAALDSLNFAAVTISETCTACGACGKVCPTEALRCEKNDKEMTFSISFSAQNCINCNLCEHVCLPDAITIDSAPSFEEVFSSIEPVKVAAGALVRCGRCKTLTASHPGVTLCPLCDYRRTHPFGSLLPQKVRRESHP
jgi:ferredoxin